jgi:DNA-binding NtrC family response regulator
MPRILIIDDEESMRSSLRRALERAGYETVDASDGRAGLKKLLEGHVDLVITDIIMPGMEGIEFMLELRRTHSGVPVIAMTGGGVIDPFQYLQMAKGIGATRVLSKPFELPRLLKEVEAALGGKPTPPTPGPTAPLA